MADSYIPTKDAPALEWMQNFASKLSLTPSLFMVSPADATAITAAVALFATALAAIATPETKRNPVLVGAKDDARTAAEAICRQFAIQIKFSAGVSDPDKISVGVRPVNLNRDPIPPPASSPVLNIEGAGFATQTVTFKDSVAEGRQKPYGVKQMQLYFGVAPAAITDPIDTKFHGLHTKSPIGIEFSPADVGKRVTYFARWCTMKGEVGPWSLPVTLAIAA